jgi:hypothetical protein
MKDLEGLSTEQLQKMRKSQLAIMLVPLILLLFTIIFAFYLLLKGEFGTSTPIIIIPVVLIGGMFPVYTQFVRVSKELKKRKNNL